MQIPLGKLKFSPASNFSVCCEISRPNYCWNFSWCSVRILFTKLLASLPDFCWWIFHNYLSVWMKGAKNISPNLFIFHILTSLEPFIFISFSLQLWKRWKLIPSSGAFRCAMKFNSNKLISEIMKTLTAYRSSKVFLMGSKTFFVDETIKFGCFHKILVTIGNAMESGKFQQGTFNAAHPVYFERSPSRQHLALLSSRFRERTNKKFIVLSDLIDKLSAQNNRKMRSAGWGLGCADRKKGKRKGKDQKQQKQKSKEINLDPFRRDGILVFCLHFRGGNFFHVAGLWTNESDDKMLM